MFVEDARVDVTHFDESQVNNVPVMSDTGWNGDQNEYLVINHNDYDVNRMGTLDGNGITINNCTVSCNGKQRNVKIDTNGPNQGEVLLSRRLSVELNVVAIGVNLLNLYNQVQNLTNQLTCHVCHVLGNFPLCHCRKCNLITCRTCWHRPNILKPKICTLC